MIRLFSCLILVSAFSLSAHAQFIPQKFGKGFQVVGKDSSFYLKFGFRFQNLHTSEWDVDDGEFSDYDGSFLVRRSRLKFDGWIHSSKLTYKLELGLSNRDIGGGTGPEFRRAANVILDASIAYKFYKNLTIQFGQRKLPGNRERVVSSGNLQFVDRSRLNSRYNIDRDVGLQLLNKHTIGKQFIIRETIAFSQGEGRNVTQGIYGGYAYTFKAEFFPFGDFKSKGAYVGSDLKREETPKLALAVAYDINNNAVRERGNLGSFIVDENGSYYGKDLKTLFIDMMFKYRGFSMMAEYADKKTSDDNPIVFDESGTQIGTFYTGSALNVQAGYLLPSDCEIAARFTNVNVDELVDDVDENQYTLGISKYIVGHKLKVQTDFTLRDRDMSSNKFIWRTQVDVHF